MHLLVECFAASTAWCPSSIKGDNGFEIMVLVVIIFLLDFLYFDVEEEWPNTIAVAILSSAFHLNIKSIDDCLSMRQVELVIFCNFKTFSHGQVGFLVL